MKFWSRNNLEELDLLTAQDVYSVPMTNDIDTSDSHDKLIIKLLIGGLEGNDM
jgi:hypothetical protein